MSVISFLIGEYSFWRWDDKTKSILFGIKHKLTKVTSLDIRYGVIHIKQYYTVKYVGCSLDENLSGESMALKFINKINSRIELIYRKNKFLSQLFSRQLCITSTQSYFDYVYSQW